MALTTFQTKETKILLTVYDVEYLQSEYLDLKLRGCDFKLHVEKATNNDDGEGINVHLERIFTANDSSYNFIATVVIELKSYDEHVPPHIDRIPPKEYSTLHRKWSLKPFIDWERLINPANRFVDDNKIELEFTVKVDELIRHDANPSADIRVLDPGTESSELKLGLTFNKVSKVSAVLSPEFLMFGMPMRIQVYKNDKFDDEENGSLCVYMWNWRNIDDGQAAQAMAIESKFKLLAYGSENKDFTSSDGQIIYERTTGRREIGINSDWIGFEHFISWKQLKELHMSPNGDIQMEISMKEIKPIDKKRSSKEDVNTPSGSGSSSKAVDNGMFKFVNSILDSVVVKCSSCLESATQQTLFRVECGHLYCYPCIEQYLKKRKECIVEICGTNLDFSQNEPKFILFD